MPGALGIRTDYSIESLKEITEKLDDKAHARRLRAIIAILEGRTRTEAAKIGGMERQTLRDWVHRFNAGGPDGLKSNRSPGRPPKLNGAQMQELAAVIAVGPDVQAHGVARWRLADIVRLIDRLFGIELDEVSVGRVMKRLGYVYSGVEWLPGPKTVSPAAERDEPEPSSDKWEAGAGTCAQPLWLC